MAADDLDRIMQVMQGAFDPEFGEAWTRRQVEDALLLGNSHYLLAGPDGENLFEDRDNDFAAAGFALSRTALDEEELLLFAVLPQYRRRGVGTRLLRRYVETAQARGIQRILLEVRRGNSAEGLYRSQGFEPIGMRPNYYRTLQGLRIDAITFALALN